MQRIYQWSMAHALKLLACATLLASATLAVFVWYLSSQFAIKRDALIRAGSESAEYVRIATTVLGTWILPALVVVSILALATFVASLRRGQPAPA
jgi:hypothetical protein